METEQVPFEAGLWSARREGRRGPVTPIQSRTPVLWLNFICLDAPLVSIAWLGLFAKSLHVRLSPSSSLALFLTAWLIYLADRFADCRSLRYEMERSLRHDFCLRYHRIWIALMLVVGAADAFLLWNALDPQIFGAGCVVGALALAHLVLNYSLGGAWPPLPMKEVTVGLLFAAGTLVPLWPFQRPISQPFLVSSLAFAALCALNCISIAYWEWGLDQKQGKVSFATRFPGLEQHLTGVLLLHAIACGLCAFTYPQAALLLGCASVSSSLLALVDRLREKVDRNHRTALADLVLLTPLLAGLIIKL